jgi:Cu-Zn family superoxide dismutase
MSIRTKPRIGQRTEPSLQCRLATSEDNMRFLIAVIWLVTALGIGLLESTVGRADGDSRNDIAAASAQATLKTATGTSIGTASLQQTPHGVLLKVDLHGAPAGVHAFHIHEVGSCEAPTFKSAGGHFAPAGRQHGFFNEAGPHAGDLPNVHVPPSGNLSFEYVVDQATLAPGRQSLLDQNGSSLVMHRDADDYRTNPAGNAGDRVACGVIMR